MTIQPLEASRLRTRVRLPFLARETASGGRRLVAAGEAVFLPEDTDKVYQVVHGLVAVNFIFRDGRRQIVDLVGPGELCFCDEDARCFSITEALTLSCVQPLEYDADTSAAEWRKEISAGTRATITRMQIHAALLGRKSSIERVASLLVRLAALQLGHDALQAPCVRVEIPLTRREIADYLGLTHETTSRSFTSLKKRRLISYETPKRALIHNMTDLRQIAASH